jgi:hypothetical protein
MANFPSGNIASKPQFRQGIFSRAGNSLLMDGPRPLNFTAR